MSLRNLILGVCLFCGAAAAEEKTVAVLPLSGVLDARDAMALEEDLRAAARETLGPHGFVVLDAAQAAGAPPDPRSALQKLGAAAVLVGRVTRMEGATVVGVVVYLPDSPAPAGTTRIVGIGMAQLRADVPTKIQRLLNSALKLSLEPAEPSPRPGTLRIPKKGPGPSPGPSPGPEPGPKPKPEAQPKPQPAVPGEEPLVTLIREVTADVESFRGLRRKSNLKIEMLDDTLFRAALHDKAVKELTPAIVAAERARWLAFGLAPSSADPAKILLEVLDEQVAGFYDPFTRQLIVRKSPPQSAAAAGPDGLRLVLAHEIEHALQDQNFGIPDLKALPDDDVRLARSALYEGDAMAVMTAYAARRAKKPVKPAIAAAAAMMRGLDTESLLRLSGHSPELLKAPAVLREELVLPYSAGLALVAEVFQRGGWPLVDKMFAHPPQSSHQVLHPDSYFSGEAPLLIAPPAAPAGTRLVTTGRMGELGARLALEVCVEPSVVKEFAPRWAGDAYTIAADRSGALSLLWASAWSGDAAPGVANLARMQSPCWEEAASQKWTGWSVSTASKVKVNGDRIGIARGAIDVDAGANAALAARAAAVKPSPPLGEVPPPPAWEPPRVENGQFVSSRLALHGDLPEGFQPDTGNPLSELTIKRTGAVAGVASLSFISEPLAGESLEAFYQTAASQIAAAQGGGHLALVAKSAGALLGARTEVRLWRIEGAGLQVRIAVVPFCAGRGALTLVRVENSDAARAVLDRFAASIKSDGPAPACADLE